MKTKIYHLRNQVLRHAAACILACTAALGISCQEDDTHSEDPYIRFTEEITSLSYDKSGGKQEIEMYTNMGDWTVETTFAEDGQWLDIWPREGRNSGRFTITVDKNEAAYSRFGTVNVVVGGKSVKQFTVRQLSSDVKFQLDMGGNNMTASAKGSEFTIGLITNIGWKAEAMGDAAGWITLGAATDSTQVLTIRRNDGDERTGQVRFYALGTGLEDFQATVNIKQFDQAHDPYNGTQLTVAELMGKLSDGIGRVTENCWVEATVVSDQKLQNFDNNQMVVQDDSGRGMLIEFANAKDNTYQLNDKLKIHLYEAEFVRDPVTLGSKLAAFTTNSVFEQSEGTPVVPVEAAIDQLDRYENTLVTLPEVEFAVPLGTYYNSQEDGYATTAVHAASAPYNDGFTRYGHILRDRAGNTAKLYTLSYFLQRYAQIIPSGSGPVSGIVLKYTKNDITENTLRMRSLSDIGVSADASTRLSNTLVQFGPFDWNATPLDAVTPAVGSGEVKSTAYRGVQSAGAMTYGWSHTRKDTPATITVAPNGKQTASPAVTQQMMYPYLYSSNFWNFIGSTMNRTGNDDPDYKGEAWVFNVTNFQASGGDLMLVFTTASSWGGPLKMHIEWADDENAALNQYHAIADYFSPMWNEGSSFQLKQFSVALPDELKTKKKFTIRFRNMANLRAPNDGGKLSSGGYSGIGFWAITERK